MIRISPSLICLLFFPLFLHAQENSSSWQEKLKSYRIQPSLGLQFWGSYTVGQEVYDEASGEYQAVENRVNVQLRRTRLSLKGQPYENLKFKFTGAMDLVGRDVLAGTEAGSNNGSAPKFRLWNAFLQWRVIPKSEKLNLVVGYFPPQIGRESITAALRSPSLEKSWSQNYLRRHLTGIGPGRAMGVNVGGLFLSKKGSVHFGYDIGLFSPLFPSHGGNSTGVRSAPLLTGRLVAYLGDPESNNYTIGRKVNYFGKRNGLSLAVVGAHQGTTDLFLDNSAAGVDLLLNWKNFHLDGEWTYLWRKGTRMKETVIRHFSTVSQTGYLRMGYNFPVSNGYFLEPVFMIVQFRGAMEAESQADAESVKGSAGQEQIINIGANFYLNPNLKLSLHYTLRNADPGAAGEGATVNNYFFQRGVGAIHRGDWIGLGVVAIF